MSDYGNWLKERLGEYEQQFDARKTVTPSEPPKQKKEPVGWAERERFGIKMRYWPRMSERFDMESDSKAAMGIPGKFMRYYIDEIEPWDRWQAQAMNYMNIMYTCARSNPLPCLTLLGGNGGGKTLLGCAFVNTVMRLGICLDHKTGEQDDWNPQFVNEADLLSRIEGYSRGGRDWFFEYTECCRLLVIDEFGMTQWTPTDTRRMNQLLNKCFGNGVFLVILTNHDATGFAALLSDQLRSRFRQGRSIQMGSPDYRPKYMEPDDDDDPFGGV